MAERRDLSEDIIRESCVALALLGGAGIFSLALARFTIEQTPPGRRDTWDIIKEMRADPEKYRIFNLQDHMPENPEVGKCKYFDPWEFWGKVIHDPQDPNKLILILCPPQHGKFP